jgi:spermidine synthase
MVGDQTTFRPSQRAAIKVSARLQCILSLIGFTAVIAQIVLMRELIVVFYGNEISLGILLAAWLLWTALGSSLAGKLASRCGPARVLMAGQEALLAVFLPLTIFAVRASRLAFESVPGETLGPGPMFFTSFTTLSLFCLLSGGLFAAGSRLCAEEAGSSTASAASSVYLLEAAGSGAGGILASLVLIRYVSSFEIALLLAWLNLLAAAWLVAGAPAARRARLALLLVAALLAPRAARRLESKSLQLLWHGFTLVESRNSIYGNLALTGTSESRSLFENGLRVLTVPDAAAAEEAVHFALLEHRAPRSLLLVGGGTNGSLEEALQYSSLERVAYVELDPAVLGVAERHFTPVWTRAATDPRVFVHPMDGRLFLRTSPARFDVIIINLPDPFTAQLNRFYTQEFFREAAEKLNEGGVFSFQVSGAENYISEELAGLLRCLGKTLRTVFPEVTVIPGETVHFLASNRPGSLTLDASELMSRLRQRRIRTQYFREYYLPFRLSRDRLLDLRQQIEPRAATPLNRDFTPIAYYFDVVLWSSRFHSYWPAWLESLAGLEFDALAGAAALGVAALVLATALLERRRIARGAAKAHHHATLGLCVAGMGFTLLGLEVLLLLGFQALYGYVYQQLAILVALFMVGMAVGAWMASRSADSPRRSEIPPCARGGERSVLGDPLTRPATADESAVAGHPFPQGGKGQFHVLLRRGEPQGYAVPAQHDRSPVFPGFTDFSQLALLQLLACCAPLLLYAVLLGLERVRNLVALLTVVPVVFPALALVAGLMGGYQFALASRLYFAGQDRLSWPPRAPTRGTATRRSEELRTPEAEVRATRSNGNPGVLYGLDLAGACLGAVALSAYLLPVYGFGRAAVFMAVVNLGPAGLAAKAAWAAKRSRA